MRIAKEVADIDVVVGGHSHSFLFTGKIGIVVFIDQSRVNSKLYNP